MSTEQVPNDIRVDGWTQTPQELLAQETMDKLWITPEVLEQIKKLDSPEKEECFHVLRKIEKQIQENTLSPSDAKDKTKNTLTEYWIVISSISITTSKAIEDAFRGNTLGWFETKNKDFENLQKNLEAVKSLDDKVVDEELKKAQQAKPDLPADLAKTISKQTGKEVKTIADIEINWGEKKTDIKNIVDSYYLANFGIEENVTKRLEWKKSKDEVQNAFSELRNSARKLEIPVDAQSKDIQKLLPDISDKKQTQVVDAVSSLTRSAPETIVTRTGEKLSFVDPKNTRYNYEIDLSQEPPKLAKALNGLSISRNIESLSEEKKELGKLEWDVQKLTAAINGQKASESINTIAWVDTSLLDEQTKDGKSPEEKQSLEQYVSIKKSLAQVLVTWSLIERLKVIQKMKEANHSLDGTRRKMINPENMTNPKQEFLEQSLWKEQEALTYLETLYQPLVDKSGRIKTLKEQTKNEWSNEDFEKNAEYNLNILTTLGYDKLGQKNMERIISFLNSPENPKKSEIGEINLNQKLDTPKNQALTLAIANLVRAGRKENPKNWEEQTSQQKKNEESQSGWDGVDKTDYIIAYRQTQSSGFKEALASVGRNMTQEWWELKMRWQLNSALFWGEWISNEWISSLNTQWTPPPTLA